MRKPVVLITGALTGIGRATALAFAARGADVVISGRREEAGHSLLSQLIMRGSDAMFVRADVRIEEEVEQMVASIISRYGHFDVAVNNAGTEGLPRPIHSETVENYQTTFDTNVLGTFLCMKHELAIMRELKRGSVINLSSMVGHIGFAGASVYSASKHAIEGLTKSAALEVATWGVRVNAIAPGPVVTDMLERFTGRDTQNKANLLATIPLKRAAEVEDIAEMILFLAGEQARLITGQVITIDGGYTAQ